MGLLDFWKGRPSAPSGVRRINSAQHAWVMRIDDGFFHVVSLIFSAGSAYAIWEIFTSHGGGDIGAIAKGAVLSVAFGASGYFLSRYIAYRLMMKEPVWLYIPVCLLVEFVEVYCNYVVGISDLGVMSFIQSMPVDQRGLLILLGRVVVSCIPGMTFFLAVAHMDLLKRRLESVGGRSVTGMPPLQPRQSAGAQRTYQLPQQQRQGQNGAAQNPTPGVS